MSNCLDNQHRAVLCLGLSRLVFLYLSTYNGSILRQLAPLTTVRNELPVLCAPAPYDHKTIAAQEMEIAKLRKQLADLRVEVGS
jgi:hypothetical protein